MFSDFLDAAAAVQYFFTRFKNADLIVYILCHYAIYTHICSHILEIENKKLR